MMRPFEEEIVEDSEPERDQQRRAYRVPDERKRLAFPQDQLPKSIDVIELTDDESGSSTTATVTVSGRRSTSKEAASHSATELSCPPTSPRNGAQVLGHMSGDSLHLDNPSIKSDESPSKIGFKRFAFAPKPVPSRKFSSSALVQSRSKANNEVAKHDHPNPQAQVLPQKRRYLTEFADTKLAKLTKCVSCDVRWTTPKTVMQKVIHLRSCAKRHLFSEETIRTLVEKELKAKSQAQPKLSKDSKKTTPVPSPQETTLLDDVVQKAPKKKSKQAEPTTIKNISDSRQSILSRARAILGRVNIDWLNDFPASQALAGQPEQPLPVTSPNFRFGKSALATKVGRGNSLFSVAGDAAFSDVETDVEYPKTVTSPSLGRRRKPSPKAVRKATQGAVSSPVLNSKVALLNVPDSMARSMLASLSENEPAPTVSTRKRTRNGSKQPEVSHLAVGLSTSPKPVMSLTSKNTLALNDDTLCQANIRSKIVQDAVLFHRILRLEPIQLSTFEKLILNMSPWPPKLRLQLQKCLDELGVVHMRPPEEPQK